MEIPHATQRSAISYAPSVSATKRCAAHPSHPQERNLYMGHRCLGVLLKNMKSSWFITGYAIIQDRKDILHRHHLYNDHLNVTLKKSNCNIADSLLNVISPQHYIIFKKKSSSYYRFIAFIG